MRPKSGQHGLVTRSARLPANCQGAVDTGTHGPGPAGWPRWGISVYGEDMARLDSGLIAVPRAWPAQQTRSMFAAASAGQWYARVSAGSLMC